MSFLKIGELIEIGPENIQNMESIAIDSKIIENFSKFASNLKKIAPKAEDFLYFSAVMMHSAEASGLNDDGTPKLTSKGEVVNVGWDKSGGTWRWKSNDPKIKPYKNSNGDIFPEEELVKAHKKWVGKPLCIDHKSSSVDHVRGFIVDTYYDRSLKRVIALCALDKFNYPDLARKVATGYSNSVSMGTAVGTAICSDCGTKAKVEADFCKCMRGRTCYGEINVDLNPIELSIVVNGADPQAKIKHIIAAANNMATYVEQKEQEFNKIATESFSATLSYNKESGDDNSENGTMSFQADSLDKLKSDIDKALQDISKISEEYKENMSENTNDGALSQTHSSTSMQESDLESTDSNIAPPAARFASQEDSVGIESQLRDITAKLETMQENLNKLANSAKQEEIMSGNKENLNKKGYFQGAGGVNEPTPGQTKYEKDPLNEQLRDNEDRQMVGAKPFPEVGSVDGLMGDDLDRKKMLARAEAEERAVKRAAIVSKAKARLEQTKQAYFQGSPNADPAKVLPYEVDKLEGDLREKSDKHMVGQKPFPEVGKVDGLHPSPDSADEKDELKRKEKLLRAALKARFVKAAKADGSHDAGNSAWEVYLGDKLLLTASVDDITGGRSESLYTAVATKEYGSELIGKVRKLGADKVAAGFAKSAQDAAPAPAPEAAAPEAAAPAGLDEVATDTGKEGDEKENALELAESVRDLTSDLVESVRALTGEQAEMGNLDSMKADDSSDENKVSTAALFKMRKELNSELLSAMKESVATLTDHEKELRTIANMYEKGAVNSTNKDLVTSLVGEAVSETKEAMAESYKLLSAFVKYARGTDAIVKRAQAEALTKENGEKMAPEHDSLMAMVDKGSSVRSASDTLDALLAEDVDSADVAEETEEDMGSADTDENNAGQVMTNDPAKAKEMADKGMDVKVTASLNSRASRDIARAKLAAEMKFHPLLDVAHENLVENKSDVKTENGHFETLEETHSAMMDFATTPVKVRKEAEAIHTLVSEGKLDAADVDTLEAHGVDPDAVKYYKQFWGQAGSEGSQFATELVKEHAKAELDEQMTQYRVKLARAYELTYEMIDRDLLPRTKEAVNNQVNEVMKWNDESFESVKKVIASQKPAIRKEASGRMPQVGFLGLEDAPSGQSDLASQLNLAFSSNKKRLF